MIDSELPDAFDQVTWQVEPDAEKRERSIPDWALEVVYYAAREAIRNADRHAVRDRPDSKPSLDIFMGWKEGLDIHIRNSGSREDRANGSTRGSGQGLSLHSTMLAVIGGTLAVESMPDGSTQAEIYLPDSNFQYLQSIE